MTLIEIAELNGAAGNSDFFAKSQLAEQMILSTVSRLIQRPIHATVVKGAHRYDFHTNKHTVGDVKIWSGGNLRIEILQQRNGHILDGWFMSYLRESEFAGLLTVNSCHSRYHNRSVFKLRWVLWPSVIDWVTHHPEHMITNHRGTYMEINPMYVQHVYLGDFFATPSVYGAKYSAFDTQTLHTNPALNIQQMHTWF